MNEKIHVVKRVEHHLLDTCPCDECSVERECRTLQYPSKNRILSVPTAYTMGFIKRRSEGGSLARQLRKKLQSED